MGRPKGSPNAKGTIAEARAAEQALQEAVQALHDGSTTADTPFPPCAPAPKPSFTAAACVQLIVDNPTWSHKQIAAHYGYPASWFAGVLASNNFQAALDPRRDEIPNPLITGTLDDMFRALTLRSLSVIQTKLDAGEVDDDFAIKAASLGIKALGMGRPVDEDAPATVGGVRALADRLTTMMTARIGVNPAPPRDYTIDNAVDLLPK